jgi:VIT1/CCC1 family predicted Fe2+/Mn2+ transporter
VDIGIDLLSSRLSMSNPLLNTHPERHLVARIGWLRAAVLGANDGIVSTASLIVGVAAAAAGRGEVMLAGVAGLVAGAMSMAAGEYVSVSSQADTEAADLSRERNELAASPEAERRELSSIYERRGLDKATADEVAAQFTANGAIGAHARDELGITHMTTARPVQAALTSAATFTAGASLPLLAAWLSPFGPPMIVSVSAASLLFLAMLGAIGAKTGGAPVGKATLRVAFWGALAMAITAGIGKLVGTAI